MKATFNETPRSTWIELQPETAEDVAALARMVQNTKAEKPHLVLYLSEKPSAEIYMSKVDQSVQKTSLSNKKD